jgi:hypothetical protein
MAWVEKERENIGRLFRRISLLQHCDPPTSLWEEKEVWPARAQLRRRKN